jgi:hypothetical protein
LSFESSSGASRKSIDWYARNAGGRLSTAEPGSNTGITRKRSSDTARSRTDRSSTVCHSPGGHFPTNIRTTVALAIALRSSLSNRVPGINATSSNHTAIPASESTRYSSRATSLLSLTSNSSIFPPAPELLSAFFSRVSLAHAGRLKEFIKDLSWRPSICGCDSALLNYRLQYRQARSLTGSVAQDALPSRSTISQRSNSPSISAT